MVDLEEMLDASPHGKATGFLQQLSATQLAHVIRDIRQGMLELLAHDLRRGRIFSVSGEAQDAPSQVMAQGLFYPPFFLCGHLCHLTPFRCTDWVRHWLSKPIRVYRVGSIDWPERIITRLFAAATRLRNRNDLPVSDVTRVAAAFGERVATLRTCKKLSQEQLADLAAVHRTAISNLEKGSHLPRLDTLLKLAGALEVEPCALIGDLPAWTPPSTSPGRFAE
jgi:DNA-binding XRE family transcriptional regulator